jgi:hypothetical protein
MMYKSKVSITDEQSERMKNVGKIRANTVVQWQALGTAKNISKSESITCKFFVSSCMLLLLYCFSDLYYFYFFLHQRMVTQTGNYWNSTYLLCDINRNSCFKFTSWIHTPACDIHLRYSIYSDPNITVNTQDILQYIFINSMTHSSVRIQSDETANKCECYGRPLSHLLLKHHRSGMSYIRYIHSYSLRCTTGKAQLLLMTQM